MTEVGSWNLNCVLYSKNSVSFIHTHVHTCLSVLIYAYIRDNIPHSWFCEEKQILYIAYYLYIKKAYSYNRGPRPLGHGPMLVRGLLGTGLHSRRLAVGEQAKLHLYL